MEATTLDDLFTDNFLQAGVGARPLAAPRTLYWVLQAARGV